MIKIILGLTLSFILFAGCVDGNADYEVDRMQCSGCAKCQVVCPAEAIRVLDGRAIIDPTKCTRCGYCVDACPEYAIY